MIFLPTPLNDAYVIELEPNEDARGYFARAYCREEFENEGIDFTIVQASLSHTTSKGTLRGMHYQKTPSNEGKLVRCARGKIFDVIIDLRRNSSSFGQHFALELSDVAANTMYVPPGFAHGFQSLDDNCDVFYAMSDVFDPELARGVRYNDPAFGIRWPLAITTISDRDRSYRDFDSAEDYAD